MICDQCKEEGKKSKVYIGSNTSTLLAWTPYYNEEGELVNNNPNKVTTYYTCSNGHSFSKTN